jgi:hypothetical protein
MKNDTFSKFAIRGLLTGLFLTSLILAGCATYTASLRTAQAGAIDQSGTYTVFRIGGNYFEDYSTFALIVPENGRYRFEIFKQDFEYRSSKKLSAKQAVNMAEVFVSSQPSFAYSRTNAVIGPDGSVIAYEVRPLYQTMLFGQSDILIIAYLLKANNVVEVRADVDDVVKRRDRGDDRRSRHRR